MNERLLRRSKVLTRRLASKGPLESGEGSPVSDPARAGQELKADAAALEIRGPEVRVFPGQRERDEVLCRMEVNSHAGDAFIAAASESGTRRFEH